MSRIYFHAEEEAAEVRGAERALFGQTCSAFGWLVLEAVAEDRAEDRPALLRKLFPSDHYVLESNNFSNNARANLRISHETFSLGDKSIDPFSINLNTAYFMGSDPVRLAARLHGQCEIHTYVEGPNRKWLADIIRKGRAIHFYRDDMGWESVIELLERCDSAPVVTSYSVCERFPNDDVARFEYPKDDDGDPLWNAWYDLPDTQQWGMSMKELRREKGLELNPDNWDRFYFGDGIDANMLVSMLAVKEQYNRTRS